MAPRGLGDAVIYDGYASISVLKGDAYVRIAVGRREQPGLGEGACQGRARDDLKERRGGQRGRLGIGRNVTPPQSGQPAACRSAICAQRGRSSGPAVARPTMCTAPQSAQR